MVESTPVIRNGLPSITPSRPPSPRRRCYVAKDQASPPVASGAARAVPLQGRRGRLDVGYLVGGRLLRGVGVSVAKSRLRGAVGD